MNSRTVPKRPQKKKRSNIVITSPYNFTINKRKSPENSNLRKRIENSITMGSYAGLESVISTRDHSSKRSNTPISMSLRSRRINSFSFQHYSQNKKNFQEKNICSNEFYYGKKNKIGTETKIEAKKIKKIGQFYDLYASKRPRSSSYRKSQEINENKANLENISKFFQDFHEKSKILLNKFEKSIAENKLTQIGV